jgi:hypothetical protein
MAFGLKILDGSGRLLLDVQDHNPRLWSTHTISGNNSAKSGFVAVSGMTRDGSWYITAGSVAITGSYFLGGTINCYAVSGGFNWDTGLSDSDGFSCSINVYKL